MFVCLFARALTFTDITTLCTIYGCKTRSRRKLYANYTALRVKQAHARRNAHAWQANHATIVCTTSPRRNAHGSTRKSRDHRVYNEPTSQRSWLNTQITRPSCVQLAHVATSIVEHANNTTIVDKTRPACRNVHG